MAILQSEISTSSKDFKEKKSAYQRLSDELSKHISLAERPESESAVERTRKRNKLLTSERIATLVDPGSSVLNIAPLAGLDLYDGVGPGAGITTCIGTVAGRTCMIVANNPCVKGGTYFPITVKKHIRAQEIALENKLPCIYLVDSGGAFLPMQDEVFPDRFHFGRIFYNQAQMSSMDIPQISVVLGSCTAGGAYVPAMSDETIMVKGNASIFLGGPPLVKAATGEVVSAEELGGADVHCSISGVADHLAMDEQSALMRARDIIRSLGPDNTKRLSPTNTSEEPLYDPKEIYGIVGTDLRKVFSIYEVLARLLDGSRFDEFKKTFGETLVCGFGHIKGIPVAVIANNGILFSESAQKAAHFIELANQRGIALLFLQNIVGFMVGKQYEHNGIAKHGAKMVTAVSTSWVPRVTLHIGGSFGAGNYGMSGRGYDPRFLFAWPNSQISVMGGEQAANVLTDVKREAGKRGGNTPDENDLAKYKSQIEEKYKKESSAYYATARLWDDGIIDPSQTRENLALSLSSCYFDPNERGNFGLFRM